MSSRSPSRKKRSSSQQESSKSLEQKIERPRSSSRDKAARQCEGSPLHRIHFVKAAPFTESIL